MPSNLPGNAQAFQHFSISGISLPPGRVCLPGDTFRCHTNHIMIWKVFIVSFKLTFLLWEAQLGCALHCKTLHGCYGLIHKIWAGLRTSWGTLLKFVKTSEDLLFCLLPPLLLYAADTYQHHRWIMSPSCLEKGEPLFKSQHWVKPLVPTCWEFKYCICSKYTLFFPLQTQPGKRAALLLAGHHCH